MKKNILIVFMILWFFPIFADAATFKDGNITYQLEERKINCLSEDAAIIQNTEDSIYFYMQKDNHDTFVKVNSDNECIIVTEEEVNSIVLDLTKETYNLVNVDGKFVIKQLIEYYDWSDFKKTEDKNLVEGKNYYIKTEDGGTTRVLEEDLKVENINDYYEILYLEAAKNKTLDENETYYILNSKYEIEVVNNPEVDKINRYYIESEKPFEVKTIQTLDTDSTQKIIDNSSVWPHVEKIGNKFYLLIGKEKRIDEATGLILFDFYDLDGNKIEGINDISRISNLNDKFVILYKENSFSIYNLELEKLYDVTNENINSLDGINYNDYVHNLVAWDEINEKEKFYTLYEYKVLEQIKEASNDKDISFKFSGKINKLSKVLLNDIELDKSNYTLEKGSTIVTLKSDYLKTLKEGDYTLKVEYGDEVSLETTFKLKELQSIIPNIPETLDNVYTYAILTFISIGIIINCLFNLRKRTKNSR